jgi:hypothetical protein
VSPDFLGLVHGEMMDPVAERRPSAAAILDRPAIQARFCPRQAEVFERFKVFQNTKIQFNTRKIQFKIKFQKKIVCRMNLSLNKKPIKMC